MRHERATEEIRELAALYALGSLTQHEARSFEMHMQEGCDVCKSEFRKFSRTLAEMGFAAEEVAAPDYIRELLMARIERESQPAIQSPGMKANEKTDPMRQKPSASPAFASILPQQQRERTSILPWVLGIALFVLAIAFYFSWKSLREANDQMQARMSVSQVDVEELRKQIDMQKGRFTEYEQVMTIVNKPEARIARLIGQASTPSNAGAFLWDTQKGRCLVIGSFLPAPQGKVYHLWLFSAATKVPVGLLKTDSEGHIFMTLQVPRAAENATAVVVSLEPDNGSQIPTAPYCAAGRIE